jgi:hypothetical protein
MLPRSPFQSGYPLISVHLDGKRAGDAKHKAALSLFEHKLVSFFKSVLLSYVLGEGEGTALLEGTDRLVLHTFRIAEFLIYSRNDFLLPGFFE